MHILILNISLKFSRFTKCRGFLCNGKSRERQPTLSSISDFDPDSFFLPVPGGGSGAECGSVTPVPRTGNVGAQAAQGSRARCLQCHQLHSSHVWHIDHTALMGQEFYSPGSEGCTHPYTSQVMNSSPGREGGRAGGLHNLPPGKGKPR